MMKRDQWKTEEIAEDFCFVCKDGGSLRVCDFKKCLKAYHPQCVGKDKAFLDIDDRWTCGSHSCNCGKSSSFRCLCCPMSYCYGCVKLVAFVQVKEMKGFCVNCLRLAKMIEENRDVDSDGEEVDFNNTETYEFLFKDYWETVKDQEGLTLVDVQAADALLKKGENFQNELDSDKLVDEDWTLEPEELEEYCDDGKTPFKCSGGKQSKKTQIKKPKKGRTYIGWASEELITFLASIGMNTTEHRSQLDVTEIVKDYIQSKNLFQGNKKRKNHVVPDETLRPLFKKKKVKYHKIFDLVKSHLAEEQSESSGDFSLSSDEDEGTIFPKKQKITNAGFKTQRSEPNHSRNKILKQPNSCYAAMVADNIKLTYLKRSLMFELLKSPETFEEKIMGCFVRIKNDPKDFYYLMQKAYQLGQVTGTKKTEHPYNIGERSVNVVLCVSNFSKEIKISMLSDDDVEEEECEELRQLMKKGLFKKLTIAELERKIKSVYEDIVNHRIDRELAKLQKQIDRANEKGWRRELNEYIDKRELLRNPEERLRLVKEIPKVIPDLEVTADGDDTETNVDGPLNLHAEIKGLEGSSAVFLENDAEGQAKGNDVVAGDDIIDNVCTDAMGDAAVQMPLYLGNETTAIASDKDADSMEEGAEKMHQGNGELGGDIIIEDVCTAPITNSAVQIPLNLAPITNSAVQIALNLESEVKSKITEKQDEKENPRNSKIPEILIIDLEEDDDDVVGEVAKENDRATIDASAPVEGEAIWHYKDPLGNRQGPFALDILWYWKKCGYFNDEFKVWKLNQCEGDAILLTAAIDTFNKSIQ